MFYKWSGCIECVHEQVYAGLEKIHTLALQDLPKKEPRASVYVIIFRKIKAPGQNFYAGLEMQIMTRANERRK